MYKARFSFAAKKTSTHREEVKLEVSVSSRKWEPQPQGQSVKEPKPVANTTADDEPMWIMDKLRAEHEPVKHAPISDTKQPETNNNDVKQVGNHCKTSIIICKKCKIYLFVCAVFSCNCQNWPSDSTPMFMTKRIGTLKPDFCKPKKCAHLKLKLSKLCV